MKVVKGFNFSKWLQVDSQIYFCNIMKPKVIEVAPAATHQVLDEISRNSCQDKDKEEHSKYYDYDKY